jgi:hypothetical protein
LRSTHERGSQIPTTRWGGSSPISLPQSRRRGPLHSVRITELSEVEELPTRRRRYRVPKLAAAIATWSTAAILVADVQLYDWTTWLA